MQIKNLLEKVPKSSMDILLKEFSDNKFNGSVLYLEISLN